MSAPSSYSVQPSSTGALSRAIQSFLSWREAHPDVSPDELWGGYASLLRETWHPYSAAWLSLRITAPCRRPLAAVCMQLADVRAWHVAFPTPEENAAEVKLWEVAFALHNPL